MRRVFNSVFLLVGIAAIAFVGMRGGQSRPDTLEAACERAGSTIGSAVVRQAWKPALTGNGVEVQFCVLRGAYDSPLAFERNAEIVHFMVVGTKQEAKRGRYTFRVTTTEGRVLEQGPAMIEAGPGFRRGCRADVCQFITEPDEYVSAVQVTLE